MLPLSHQEVRNFDPPSQVENAVVVFTDGSWRELWSPHWGGYSNSGAGVAWWNAQEQAWNGKGFAVPDVGGRNDEAEMYAIYEALNIATAMIVPGDGAIFVHTDSQCVINAIEDVKRGNSAVRLPLVKEITEHIVSRTRYLEKQAIAVDISWVKAHAISIGNELADCLARRSAGEVQDGSLAAEEAEISQKEIDAIAKEVTVKVLKKRNATLAPQKFFFETADMRAIRENLPEHLQVKLVELWIRPDKAKKDESW